MMPDASGSNLRGVLSQETLRERGNTMKAGRSLVELATEIERQRDASHDYKAPSPQVALVPSVETENTSLKLDLSGIGQFEVNPLAHDQIGQHTGIPSKYYDRMLTEAPELLA